MSNVSAIGRVAAMPAALTAPKPVTGSAMPAAPVAPQQAVGLEARTAPAKGLSVKTPAAAAPTLPAAGQRVQVWDMKNGDEVQVPIAASGKIADPVARTAYRNAVKVDSFLRTTFNRDGWDGKGAPLRVVVHTPDDDGQPLNNAYWDADRGKVYFGDGDGKIFSPLGGSLDVMTHEAAHAIVDSEVHLRYSGQQGGINESWADVLGALADKDDWLIGEDVFTPGRTGDAIRDLTRPRFSHVKEIPADAEVDVHDLSGVPSLAAVRVADRIGREQMGQIWYRALTDHLDSRAGFAGAARATLRAAQDLYGPGSSQFAAVADAWKAVGVYSRFKG